MLMPYVESGDRGNSCLRASMQWMARRLWKLSLILMTVCLLPAGVRGQANVTGQWQTLSAQMPINPIHLSLMHNGNVLVVSGSGNLPSDTDYMAGVWNPTTQTITTQPLTWDMFCNGMIVLPDGRPFVVGGTIQYDPFFGSLQTAIYDPATGIFSTMQPMAHGRWYPTATVLGNGSVMVYSGLDENSNTNTTVEIYTVGQGWAGPYQSGWTPPLYPRMTVLPNGNVFYSGPTTSSAIFNPTNQQWTMNVATTNYSGTRTYGSSVLLPLLPANNYDPKIMILGGGSPATATTEIIDMGASSPKWVYGPNMSEARIEMDAVMLPNGNVLAINGSVDDEDATTESLNADMYNPTTNTFSSAGQGAYPRLYHSGGLLMPDGTVLVVGGNPERGTYEPYIEVYSPPYLFNSSGGAATRPTITSVTPGVIGYGSTFQIQTPNAASITSAVLIRAGSPTHAFDMDQRLVGLNFTAGSGVLTATAPPNGNIAPPGYYLLFLLNSSGVPSIAQFVQLSLNPTDTAPSGTITSPTGNVTILPGQTVSFAGTGTSPSGTIAGYSWVFPGGTPGTSNVADPGAVTFSTPGTYEVTLTVTDNNGVTDPSPPTRLITVSPDFSLSPSPTIQSVVPGGTATVNITVAGSGDFTSTVSFGLSGLPPGVTATLNPTTVTGPGTTAITLTASSSVAVGSYPITVTGTTSADSHTTSFTLNVTSSLPTVNGMSVDFVGTGTPMSSSEVAGVVALSNWNEAEGASSSSALSLVDETGAATTATVSWTSDDDWAQPITLEAGNVQMMQGYLDNGNEDTTTVTVNGLPSNPSGYTVYVYAQGASSDSSNTGIYQISGTGVTTTSTSLTYDSDFNGTFTQATTSNPIGNYVVFTIPNVPGFTLSAIPSTASDGYERAPVNGMQIIPIAPANPNFTLAASPSTQTVGLSSTTTYTVTIGAQNGFTGTVTLSASGLPTGATASFSPATVTTSGTSTLTITTGAGTPTGASTITITGTSGTLVQSANVTLNVSGPDFSISATPSTNSVTPGSSATYTVSMTALYGYTGSVTLTYSGLPAGATATFSPSTLTSGSSTLTISTSSSTPGGTSTITITGTGTEEEAHSITVTLTVVAPDFSISLSPSSNSVVTGGSATYTVTIAPLNGFTGTVNLGVSAGLPTGATDTFAPTSISTSGTSTLTVNTGSAAVASYTLTITGTSGSLSHSTAATLNITSSYSMNAISIDFVGTDVSMASSETAGVVAVSNWNNATGAKNSTPVALVDQTGAATTAAVTWSADDVWEQSITDEAGNVRMMKGYLDNGNQDTTVINVTGLPYDPNGYAVYVYADGAISSGSDSGIYQISGSGITTSSVTLTYTSQFSGTFTQATASGPVGNYVVLNIPGVSGFTLSAIPSTSSSGYERAPVNGIQIVPLGPPNPDFTVGVTPSTQTVVSGNSVTYTVNIGELNGFSSSVGLSVSGLPTGVTGTFSPTSVTAPGSSTLTVTVPAGTAASTNTLTITGTSGSLTHTATATLDLAGPPSFSVSASPSSFAVNPGNSATYTVSVSALNGFTGAVGLGASGLPSGASFSFSPTSVSTSGTSTLTISTTSSTPVGSSTVTITGTSGSLTSTAKVTLVVTNASTSGNPISIQFVGDGEGLSSSQTAGVVPEANWNTAEGASSGSPLALFDSTGTATTATIAWQADDVWFEGLTISNANEQLMDGYLDNGQQDTTTITVSGLPPSSNGYTVYVYASGSTSGTNSGIYQISGTGITTSSVTLTYKSDFNGTFTQATASSAVGNYVVFTIPDVSSFTLSAIPSTASSGFERAPVNGIQIVP
jgi:Domain of unknown function (DUF1929)/PKD domain